MNTPEIRTELHHILMREAETAERLLQVLRAEHDAVANGDADKLETLLAEKQPLIQQLEQCWRRHSALLVDAGVALDRIEQGLLQLSNGEALGAVWIRLRDAIASCREQNQRNGRLVAFRRRKTEQALSILLGGASGNESYGPDGNATSSAAASRPLTSA